MKRDGAEGLPGVPDAGSPETPDMGAVIDSPAMFDAACHLAAAASLCGAQAIAIRPLDLAFGAPASWSEPDAGTAGEALARECGRRVEQAAQRIGTAQNPADGPAIVAIPSPFPSTPTLGWLAASRDGPFPAAALDRAAQIVAPLYAFGREHALRRAAGSGVTRLLRHHGDVMLRVSATGVVIHIDESVVDRFGFPVTDFIGRRWSDALLALGVRGGRRALRPLLAAERDHQPIVSEPLELLVNEGEIQSIEISSEPMTDLAGVVVGALVAIRDVTQLREAAAVGERAAARLIEGLEVVSGGFALFDRSGRLVLGNRAYREQLAALGDFAPDQPITMHEIARRGADRCVYVGESSDGGYEARRDRRMNRFLRGDGKAYEQATMDGKYWEVAERRTHTGDTAVFRVDVTDRKLAEQRLRDAIECLPLGFAMFDPQDRFVLCNARYRDFYPELAAYLERGVSFRRLCEICYDQIDAGRGHDREAWIERRLTNHRGGGPFVMTTTEGRSILVCESRTMEGGYVAAHVDISAQRMLQDQLAHQTRRVEIALRTRSEFLANLSHEMRTPLNAIIGFADMIAMGARGPLDPAYTELAGMIRQSGNFLLSLIVDILDLSRIEAGRMPLNCAAVDVADAVAEAVMMLTPQARAKGLILEVALPPDLPAVWAERRRLIQMMQNVVSNAVKFTSAGAVRVGAHVSGDRLHIVVADTGRGMTDLEIQTAMTPFAQVAGRDMIDGSGLGLPLVKAMAEMQDGDLGIRSEPGRGTEVTISLPLARGVDSRVA